MTCLCGGEIWVYGSNAFSLLGIGLKKIQQEEHAQNIVCGKTTEMVGPVDLDLHFCGIRSVVTLVNKTQNRVSFQVMGWDGVDVCQLAHKSSIPGQEHQRCLGHMGLMGHRGTAAVVPPCIGLRVCGRVE